MKPRIKPLPAISDYSRFLVLLHEDMVWLKVEVKALNGSWALPLARKLDELKAFYRV